MKHFKAWGTLALAIGFCVFPLPGMAQQQNNGILGGPAGSFLQNIFGFGGNDQSAGYPGSAANRNPLNQNYAPNANSNYQGNDDDYGDDQDQGGMTSGGRPGNGNYSGGGRGQYGSSYGGEQGAYHRRNGNYDDGEPSDSQGGYNNQGNGYGNGGYPRRRHRHHHQYQQNGYQGNGNGPNRYQNQNGQYNSNPNQQPDRDDGGNSNY